MCIRTHQNGYVRMHITDTDNFNSIHSVRQTQEENPHPWAVRHSDKSPLKGIYPHQSTLKMLAIHKGFLRFLP